MRESYKLRTADGVEPPPVAPAARWGPRASWTEAAAALQPAVSTNAYHTRAAASMLDLRATTAAAIMVVSSVSSGTTEMSGDQGPQPRQPSSPRVSSESSWEMKGWANAPRSSQMFKMRLSCSFSCVVHRSQTFSNAFGRAPRKASVSDVSFFLDCRMMSLAKNMYFIFFCGVSFSSSESHICGEIWTPCNLHKRECFVMMVHDPHGERLY